MGGWLFAQGVKGLLPQADTGGSHERNRKSNILYIGRIIHAVYSRL